MKTPGTLFSVLVYKVQRQFGCRLELTLMASYEGKE